MTPKVTLLIVTDGRADYLARTWESAQANLKWDWHEVVVVDDSASWEHAEFIDELIGPDTPLPHDTKQGGAAAVRTAWDYLRTTDTDYVFHLEDDWLINDPIDVAELVEILETHKRLANVVLRRQPHPSESHAGPMTGMGRPETHPILGESVAYYTEHTRGFWLNPCLYPIRILDYDWPEHGHETHFGEQLVAAGYSFAFYRGLDDPPAVHHIGDERSQGWAW